MYAKGDKVERLQKVIANSGYTSRRKAEDLILKGHVKVNGSVVKELGTKVSLSDEIMIGNDIIKQDDKIYVLLNKPRGVITSTSDDKRRKTVVDLIDTDYRIYPVGRLDYDTTGALLLTNDGELTNLLTHPKNEVEKIYIAKIEGILLKPEINRLQKGVIFDNHKSAPAKVKVKKYDKKTNTSLVQIIIHEGKNHQVKKMFEAINHEVIKLKREKFSFLDVKSLKSGEYRYLNPKEVKRLYFEATKQ